MPKKTTTEPDTTTPDAPDAPDATPDAGQADNADPSPAPAATTSDEPDTTTDSDSVVELPDDSPVDDRPTTADGLHAGDPVTYRDAQGNAHAATLLRVPDTDDPHQNAVLSVDTGVGPVTLNASRGTEPGNWDAE